MLTSSTASAHVVRLAGRAAFTATAYLLLSVWVLGQTKPSTPASGGPDYSQEPSIAESIVSRFAFENDGTGTQESTVRLRIQTGAGVQQWGLLSFPYQKANETIEIAYVRVRKPDGTVVMTPPENFQDIESDVSRLAPMYSDLRQKQVAVRGLSPGDVLEYRMQSRTHTPQVAGQFWLSYNFAPEGITLDEQLEVSVPRSREVKVKSADAQPVIREEGARRFYTWKTNRLRRKTDEEKRKESKKDAPPPSVQLTSFRSWEEVGKWYGDLQSDRVVPSAEVRAKAAELTRTAVTEMEKVRAIYQYVSSEFRYIAINFGAGRYQPHAAGDVLANQYGDCKDKHTLLASLLRAVGITAQPVLVNSSRKIDEDVPSPVQFDHVVSRVIVGKEVVWLDTTPEVAPFGLLLYALRDKQALFVSDKPELVKTPAMPPMRNSEEFSFEGKLGDDGRLQGTIRRATRGDSEVLYRLVFRRVEQPKWKELVQSISYNTGFAGTVDDIKVGSPLAPDQPFEFSYTYDRKDFSDWSNRRVTPPLPGMGVPSVRQEDEKPVDPLELGPPSEFIQRAKLQMPPSYAAQAPSNVDASNDFAEYHARYELKEGVLSAERRLNIKQHEVPVAKLAEWKKFAKAVEDDTGRYIVLAGKDQKPATPTQQNGALFLAGRDPEAVRIFMGLGQAFQRGDFQGALETCRRVLAIDPKFPRAWFCIANAYMAMRRRDDAMDAFRKEMDANPEDVLVMRSMALALSSMGKRKDAIEVWRKLLKIAPDDLDAATNLGSGLLAAEQYKEAVGELEPLVKAHPKSGMLMELLGKAYLKTDQPDKGVAVLEKAVELDLKPVTMNDVAYYLADQKLGLDQAERWAMKAVKAEEKETGTINLTNLEASDLGHMRTLASYWDTLGWVYSQRGDLSKAESNLKASWDLYQSRIVGDHLGRVYQQEGKLKLAFHIYELAMASGKAGGETSQRDERLTEENPRLTRKPEEKRAAPGTPAVGISGADELSRMRTIKLPRITDASATAEYFVLFSPGPKVAEVKFINGSPALRDAGKALASALYPISFPEGSQAKLVRRGILMCAPTSGCNFVLLTVDSVRTVN